VPAIVSNPESSILIFEKVGIMARTAFKPTDAQRYMVKVMSRYGIRQEDIATEVGLRSPKTLRKHFREELDLGRIGADIEVGKSLFKMASSGRRPSATFYYLNRQAARRARSRPLPGVVVVPDFVVEREKEAA
jgi:hypothetical protein